MLFVYYLRILMAKHDF